MFNQMNLFVLIFLFSSYSFGTVEGSDFFTDLGKKAWEGLKEAGEALLDGINEATKALVMPGWECGPNDPKRIDGPSHLATQTLVLSSTCIFHITAINQCCKNHDKCCNEDFVNDVPLLVKERKKPCDLPFCECLRKTAGIDVMCLGILSGLFCVPILAAGDPAYDRYLEHKSRCKGLNFVLKNFLYWTGVCNGTKASKLYDSYRNLNECEKIKDVVPELTNEKYEADKKQDFINFKHIDRCKGVNHLLESCTDLCNGTKCSDLYDKKRIIEGCEKIKDVVPALTNEKYEADEKQEKKCAKLCDEKSGQCVDPLKACYKTCSRSIKECEIEYCKCKKSHPECLVNLMCTPSEDVMQLRNCNECPQNEVTVEQKSCADDEDEDETVEPVEPSCDNPKPKPCRIVSTIHYGYFASCQCVPGLLRDQKTGKCVEKEKCT
ncbi:hypothetical protein niasHS_003067 [Heterodera schachtii]|uniref:Uncharacterized protein n=1 Tax=Heterodera schachtii TaxID=97005 RepID=A0ABD2K9U6_HETSC